RFSAPGFSSTSPRFSSDGTHLIYTSTRPGYEGTTWAVRMDRPGGEFPYTQAAPQNPQGSSPRDNSFIVTTGPASAAGQGQARGGGGRQGGGQGRGGQAATGEYGEMPPMARPPVNSVTLPLDPK